MRKLVYAFYNPDFSFKDVIMKYPDAAGDIKLMAMGGGFHAINPQAAVYWNPANTASGSYTLKGSFKLMKPSGHTNFYGLVFGGADLDGADLRTLRVRDLRSQVATVLQEPILLPTTIAASTVYPLLIANSAGDRRSNTSSFA